MPSLPWRVWFLATRAAGYILAMTALAGFLTVFVVPHSSAAFLPLAALSALGLVVLFVQQFFDFRYAREHL